MTDRRYALITGASSGIGAAMARLAVARGADVGLAARRQDRLDALAQELVARGAEADVFAADLAQHGAAERLAAQVNARGRQPDMLINSAGVTITKGYAGTTWQEQRAFLELMISAPAALTHAFLPSMLARRWGRIINISSIAALSSGGKGNTLYPAGKSFLLKFSQSLNAEVRERGVHVTAVLPGFVATEFQTANGIPAREGEAPRRFSQTPEEVAKEAWVRNEKGHEIVVPGMPPKLAAGLMRALPEPVMRALTRSAAEKYYVGE
ncbi:MAG: SDR family NAD(P)-dependent oxidoreductase [Hyphomonadaceae bacterium]